MSSNPEPILVTGAAGHIGNIGGRIVRLLRDADIPVRALVRCDDERASRLRHLGADVVIADLTKSEEVLPALERCKRVYFGTGVSPDYLEATLVTAAAARAIGGVELFLNMSQMTISEMDLTHMTDSPQQRQHWLCEQALNWSGLPVTHLRPTVFQQNFLFWDWAAESIFKSGTIRLPFGHSRTSPIAAEDVAEVAARILRAPAGYTGRTIELTGPRCADLYGLADEYATALKRSVSYVDVPFDIWRDEELSKRPLPDYVRAHILTMAKLHAAGRYDRLTDSVQTILGRTATSLETTLEKEHDLFQAA
ncbi:NmrA family NAD(P)-binding protein [Gluconacetobacter sp. Hr-1-5]|uniref:NmrA family NAD(P)-binding protein n=1 Tax=Gluconacetobacter sp. Hr-1-5 TaxID=3395370 RepID=UPI003B526C78